MTALPPILDRFGTELEDAARRDLGRRRRRRWTLRAAAITVAAAAVAFGLLSTLPAGGPSAVERAAAALQPSDDTILHFQLKGEQRNPDGSVVGWRSETWQLRVAPYTRRQIEVGSDGIRAESVTRGDVNELYDARSDTIYSATGQQLRAANMPRIEIVSKSELQRLVHNPRVTAAFRIKKGDRHPTVVATTEGAKRVREELAGERKASNGAVPDEFRSEILAMLRSGRARKTGEVVVEGRKALRIESAGGRQVYFVDAATCAPIEWVTRGNGGSVTLRFPVYEELPVDSRSLKLLDLRAQHPGAKVVSGATAYLAADHRLFPHG
jgi:hypothetical protein